ncbi:MAG: Stp1/IreP family PP2C-type Ser/Thr phosphatase [Actinomycetota bacterium]|nr:Stp1/IreP family PP2C-type Ser/Thr phosphatase [Actinomycetota bacterium]
MSTAVGQSTVITDTGRKRRHNEDSFVHRPPLFAVADGMGGAQAGEVASRLAAAALKEDAVDGNAEQRLVALIQEANRRVFQRANEDAAASGMGTTITAALVESGAVWIGHVGDSRAYLVRDGKLQQLTDDHSLVGELQRSGKLSAEEAEIHPQRSVITRAVGTDPDVDVDTFPIEPRTGDVFLICSDGLTDMIDDGAILETVEQHYPDLEAAARALVGAANKRGGEDNITVVAFEISDGGPDALERTATMPAPGGAADPDEEDTLSGIEAVPVVDTMVVPPEEIEQLAEEREEPKPRRRFWPRLLALLSLIALLAGAAYVVWRVVR